MVVVFEVGVVGLVIDILGIQDGITGGTAEGIRKAVDGAVLVIGKGGTAAITDDVIIGIGQPGMQVCLVNVTAIDIGVGGCAAEQVDGDGAFMAFLGKDLDNALAPWAP